MRILISVHSFLVNVHKNWIKAYQNTIEVYQNAIQMLMYKFIEHVENVLTRCQGLSGDMLVTDRIFLALSCQYPENLKQCVPSIFSKWWQIQMLKFFSFHVNHGEMIVYLFTEERDIVNKRRFANIATSFQTSANRLSKGNRVRPCPNMSSWENIQKFYGCREFFLDISCFDQKKSSCILVNKLNK